MYNSILYQNPEVAAEIERLGMNLSRCRDVLDPQSIQFMADLLPVLRFLYPGNGKTASFLDVGSRTAAGISFLQMQLNPKGNSKLKINATALDIDPKFMRLANLLFPELEYLVADIYELHERKWDTVICSHTIEHVPNPDAFLRQLCSMANDFVVVSCPYKEDAKNLVQGHINSIDDTLINQFPIVTKHVYSGFYWYQSDIVIFVIDAKKYTDHGVRKGKILSLKDYFGKAARKY